MVNIKNKIKKQRISLFADLYVLVAMWAIRAARPTICYGTTRRMPRSYSLIRRAALW